MSVVGVGVHEADDTVAVEVDRERGLPEMALATRDGERVDGRERPSFDPRPADRPPPNHPHRVWR